MLASTGVSPRVSMELMRHSDMKLTMGVYTDVAQLPIIQETARLPSFQIPAKSAQGAKNSSHPDTHIGTQRCVQTGVAASREPSSPVANMCDAQRRNSIANYALGHEKAAGDATSRLSEMEREKRLELADNCPEVPVDHSASIDITLIDAQREAHEKQGEKLAQNHALLRLERAEGGPPSAWPESSIFDSEIRELVDTWVKLNPEIRAAIMSIVRNSQS